MSNVPDPLRTHPSAEVPASDLPEIFSDPDCIEAIQKEFHQRLLPFIEAANAPSDASAAGPSPSFSSAAPTSLELTCDEWTAILPNCDASRKEEAMVDELDRTHHNDVAERAEDHIPAMVRIIIERTLEKHPWLGWLKVKYYQCYDALIQMIIPTLCLLPLTVLLAILTGGGALLWEVIIGALSAAVIACFTRRGEGYNERRIAQIKARSAEEDALTGAPWYRKLFHHGVKRPMRWLLKFLLKKQVFAGQLRDKRWPLIGLDWRPADWKAYIRQHGIRPALLILRDFAVIAQKNHEDPIKIYGAMQRIASDIMEMILAGLVERGISPKDLAGAGVRQNLLKLFAKLFAIDGKGAEEAITRLQQLYTGPTLAQ